MAETYSVITQDIVNVVVSNSAPESSYSVERRFQKGITIADLKGKLELLTGGSSATMKVQLFDKNDTLICTFDNDDALLGSYPVEDAMRIHVIDKFVLRGSFEDTSKVDKFELSEAEYSKKSDTLKAYLLQNKLGKYNEEEMKQRLEEKKKEEEAEEECAKALNVGDRCQTVVSSQPRRRGIIMYIGKVDFKPGWWIGVKYDEPLGKNDGSVNGKRYFECPPKYGGFVKPFHVSVGDFPEEEYDLDEEI